MAQSKRNTRITLHKHMQECRKTYKNSSTGLTLNVQIIILITLIGIMTGYIPGISLFDLEHIRGCCINLVLYKCFYSNSIKKI